MRNFVFLMLAAGVCLPAQSQMARSSPNNQQLNMPGPPVQNLLLGTWSITTNYPPKPNESQGSVGKGTEVWRPGPGGRSIIEEYHEKNSNGEVEGLGVVWWDLQAKGQRFVWCENDLPSGCYVSSSVAKWEGESLVWKEEQMSGGTKNAYSEVFREITPDSFVQELQEGTDLQSLHRTAIISATRITGLQPTVDPGTNMPEPALRVAIAKRHEAMVDGDEDLVDQLTAKEYSQTDIFGHVQNKAAWMAEYFRPLAFLQKTGKFRWERYEESDVQVTILGPTAVVTGALSMKGTGAKFTTGKWEESPQSTIEGTLRFTRVWVKQDGAWVLAALHNAAPLGVQTKSSQK